MRKEILADGNLKDLFKLFSKTAFGLFVLDPLSVLEMEPNLIYILYRVMDLISYIYTISLSDLAVDTVT